MARLALIANEGTSTARPHGRGNKGVRRTKDNWPPSNARQFAIVAPFFVAIN